MTGLSVDIFVGGPGLPPFEFPRTLSKIWREPTLKYITNSPLGTQAKFHKGPIGFLRARGPSPPPPPPPTPTRALHDYKKVFQCPQDLDINGNFQNVGFLLIWNKLCIIKYIYIYE